MAAAAPLPALVNAHDGMQIGGICMAFSKSKARATPGLASGPGGLGLFHQGHTCTRQGRRDAAGFAAWGPVTKIVDRCQRAVSMAGAEDRAAPHGRKCTARFTPLSRVRNDERGFLYALCGSIACQLFSADRPSPISTFSGWSSMPDAFAWSRSSVATSWSV